jgi:hypothetical protein
MRDTTKLPTPGPIVLALVAEVVVVIAVFASAALILLRVLP